MFERQHGCWDNGGIFDDGDRLVNVSIYEDETLVPLLPDGDGNPRWPWTVEIDGKRYEGFDFQTSRTMYEARRYRAFVGKVTPCGLDVRIDPVGDFWFDTHEEWVRGVVSIVESM